MPLNKFPISTCPLRPLKWLAGATIILSEAFGATPGSEVEALKRLSLDELLNLEVTSVARAPQKLSETASAIQVVTNEDIRRSGATSIPETLRLATNLNVARKDAHGWGISARGFNTEFANKLLVLMDGRTLYTPLFSGVRWDVQHYLMADLERIEVISGPGGSLWGSNAVNGVINITSKSARDTQGLHVEAGAGTQLRQNYGFRYGGAASPNVFYRVYGTYFDRANEEVAGGPAHDAWSMSQMGFRIDAEPTTSTLLTFQGDAYQGVEDVLIGGESDVSGQNLLGRWTQTLANGSEATLQVYFDRTRSRQPVVSLFAPPGYAKDRLDTFDVDFQHQLRFGSRSRLVWGLGYRVTENWFEPAPGLTFDPPFLRQELGSGFAQVEIPVAPAVMLTIGSKLEHTDYTGFEVEPAIRLQWDVTSDSLLWGAISRAVRTPSRVDRDIRQPSQPPAIATGGPTFDSETVVAYEAGYRIQMTRQWGAAVAVFYNRYDDLRSLEATPATIIPLFFANDLEAETYGVELTTTWQPLDWWRVHAGYTLLKEDVWVEAGGSDLNNALNETADPEHQFSLRSSMELGRGFEFDAMLRWVDELRINNVGVPVNVPSYGELDLRLGWRTRYGWEFSIVGRNLLDASHPEFGLPIGAPVEFKRSVFAKAAWSF